MRQWNFIGNKSQLSEWLCDEVILPLAPQRVADVCTGTGSISRALATRKVTVWSNDVMYWCTVLARTYLMTSPYAWNNVAVWVRERDHRNTSPAFIHATYTPAGGHMYFTEANGQTIDTIRQEIDQTFGKETDAFHVALTVLLHASMLVANTAGQFRSYLKTFKPSAVAPLVLDIEKIGDSSSGGDNIVTCQDVFHIVEEIATWADVIYMDPPYCHRHYPKYYHVMETIARYDNPLVEGRTVCRQDAQISRMGCRRTAKQAFSEFVERVMSVSKRRATHLVVSYSTEGIVDEQDMQEALSLGGQLPLDIYRHPHPKYQTQSGSRAYIEELAFVVTLEKGD